jgi:hypothetical protein
MVNILCRDRVEVKRTIRKADHTAILRTQKALAHGDLGYEFFLKRLLLYCTRRASIHLGVKKKALNLVQKTVARVDVAGYQ